MKRRSFVRSAFGAAALAWVPGDPLLGSLYRVGWQVPPDVDAVTGDGESVTLRGRDIVELARAVKGNVLLSGDDGYDNARRILNPSFDKRPALIVQVTGAADVATAVDFARDNELLVSVKCGGHSASGKSTCDRGMMIDLSTFRAVTVDPDARRARVTGGSLLGQLDHEAMAHGLVTPMGTVSHTGVGGLTTGGGFGRVARRFGLSVDNLTGVQVVAADGQLYWADAEENPDLFWGVRGGGGNFGVVTVFEFELHPMERQVLNGAVVYPWERAREVISLYDEYVPEAPDELDLVFFATPPGGSAPPGAGIAVCYSGQPNQADRALAPIRALGRPVADTVEPMDYVAVQRSGDIDDFRARAAYLKSGFVPGFPPGLIDAIVEGLEGDPNRSTSVACQPGMGAISRVPNDATAFSQRDAMGNLLLSVDWENGADPAEHVEWIRETWTHMEPFTQGFYVNDADAEVTMSVSATYGDNYRRLVQVKNEYDPSNLFRLNSNVVPTV